MSGRTPEERERARLEREARRAARGGRRGRAGEEPPAAPPERPAVPPERSERPAVPPRERPARGPRVPGASTPGGGGDQGRPARGPRPRIDVERVRRLARERRAGREAPGELRPPRVRAARGLRFRILAGVTLVVGVVLVWLLVSLFQPFKGGGSGSVHLAIPTGAGVGEIATLLEKRGVVSSAAFFELRATIAGRRGDLKPGVYDLRRDMSYGAAIDALAAGPPNELIRFVIPEGQSRNEVARLAADAGLVGDYERASVRSSVLDPRRYGARGADSLEGFLWPATYELKRGSSARGLVRRQLEAFKQSFRQVSLARARRKNLTAYDVLIIASMVEREARLEAERPIIASVIYNRLRRGEPLGIDATIRYATRNWTKPLTGADLRIDSPYNTRTRAGLPPGPIGSPGLASIRAAARPASTSYLFYVVKPGTCGEHAFSRTLQQFERDAARYDRERRARGGQSPTNC